jgi:hypothetical protein
LVAVAVGGTSVGVGEDVGVDVAVAVPVGGGVVVDVGDGVTVGVALGVEVPVGVLLGGSVACARVGVGGKATETASAPKNVLLHVQRPSATIAVITGNNIFQRSMHRPRSTRNSVQPTTTRGAGLPPF